MKTPLKIGIGSLAAIGVAGSAWLVTHRTHQPTISANPSATFDKAIIQAPKSPKAFIAKNEGSKELKIQTSCPRAEMPIP